MVPRTRRASKYIMLYRAIEEQGFYVTDPPSSPDGPGPRRRPVLSARGAWEWTGQDGASGGSCLEQTLGFYTP